MKFPFECSTNSLNEVIAYQFHQKTHKINSPSTRHGNSLCISTVLLFFHFQILFYSCLCIVLLWKNYIAHKILCIHVRWKIACTYWNSDGNLPHDTKKNLYPHEKMKTSSLTPISAWDKRHLLTVLRSRENRKLFSRTFFCFLAKKCIVWRMESFIVVAFCLFINDISVKKSSLLLIYGFMRIIIDFFWNNLNWEISFTLNLKCGFFYI